MTTRRDLFKAIAAGATAVPLSAGVAAPAAATCQSNLLRWAVGVEGQRKADLGDGHWIVHDTRMEVSGWHHNVFGGFLSLKPAIYAAGSGTVTLRDFGYRALDVNRVRT